MPVKAGDYTRDCSSKKDHAPSNYSCMMGVTDDGWSSTPRSSHTLYDGDHDGDRRPLRSIDRVARGRSALTVNAVYRSLSIVLHH